MLFDRRAPTKPLAEFLRRLGMSLESGIDIRRALASEVNRSPASMRAEVESIEADVATGRTLAQGFDRCGEFFPPLARELVDVGEQSGHLPEVLKQLTEHYEQRMAMWKQFVGSITWPMVQFGIAIFVLGFLIWISGVIEGITRAKTDILGMGLTGTRGLVVYLVFLGAAAVGILCLYRSIMRGELWVAPIQRAIFKVPMLGQSLQTMAIARFAWTLHLTTHTALDVKKCLRLALKSTHHVEFTSQISAVEAGIQRGNEIHEVLAATHVFPSEFIHAVQVGEESGRLTESLGVVARQYQDESRRALAILTQFAGYAVWAVVAVLIILLIFRLFGSYVGAINQAVEMTMPHRK
ncbi:MAG: type II secretion system F family protein [Pirellulales bacterium]|nr:type II secretion system F family protein [Pirellulales bacterium]